MRQIGLFLVTCAFLLNPSGCVTPWGKAASLSLVWLGSISQVDSIKCYMDNQGIPVEEEPYIIPEFKEFDCSLGGGKHKNCMKYTKEYDGQMLVYRNCGVLEEKSGCKKDVANVTRCYCSEDYCNTATTLSTLVLGIFFSVLYMVI
eukprot:GFUD01130788.1.p1 GENE.GFUD01130788.1~~GFUD01130788.1.p1  ORF type:complete len:146 (-),score=32.41 GFUD01130788.1:26-463(-)